MKFSQALGSCALIAAIVHSQPALAQTVATFDFSVPAGSLETVLTKIVAQAGAKYRFEGGNIPDMQVEGVEGRFTLNQAVAKVLDRTGWRVASYTNGQIRLVRDNGDAGEIVVTARRQSFKQNFTSSATRTNTPLRQTPATIDAVTQDILESRNAFSLTDALKNIPGATFKGGVPSQIQLGSDTTAGTSFTDGLRNGSFDDNRPTYIMDSIEVLKGPASLLTGTQVGGALLNYVPKRANGVNQTDITLGIGSYRETTAGVDFGGSIPLTKGLYYRVIGFAQHGEHAPNGSKNPYQYDITPMLGYRSDNTTIDLSAEYSDQRLAFAKADYLNASNDILHFNDALFNPVQSIRTKSKRGAYNLDQNLVDTSGLALKLRVKGLYSEGTREGQAASPLLPNYPVAGSTYVTMQAFYQREWNTSHYGDLYAKFDTGPLQHQLIVGGDFSITRARQASVSAAAFPAANVTPTLPAIPYAAARSSTLSRQYGAMVQDQINWGAIHVLAGVRHSWFYNHFVSASRRTNQRVLAEKWTPSGGVVLDVTKALSVYGSYTSSFSPPSASQLTVSGEQLPPVERKRWEAGAKAGLFGDRLDLNLSLFRFTTSNSSMSDLLNPGFYTTAPGDRAKGAEVAAQGAITPTLKVVSGYTYTTGHTTNAAIPLLGSVKHNANLFLLKSVKVGGGKLDLGLGGNYRSGSNIQDISGILAGRPVTYRAFNRPFLGFDGTLGYTLDKVRLNLTVNNILDRQNYQIANSAQQLSYEPGRTFRFVIDTKF